MAFTALTCRTAARAAMWRVLFLMLPTPLSRDFQWPTATARLSAGAHSISAVAYDASGLTQESVAQFEVVKFSEDFISGADAVDLSGGSCTASGDQIALVDALVSGTLYDLVLKWREAEQGFEIVEIR